MLSLSVIKTLIREIVTSERALRIPEPDLVMDDPDKVAAFIRAGEEDGVMAPVYIFHSAQICEVIRAGDLVIDLGCGAADQLGMVARLNPNARFIGLDMSGVMLAQADAHIKRLGLDNVLFKQADITDLTQFSDSAVDAIISTAALHHLPDIKSLERTFSEVSRVLKPGGGLYIVDFRHLKSEKSIEYFASQHKNRQPELFTLDYLNSLRAAFYKEDYIYLNSKYMKDASKVYSSSLMPFMVAVKSANRRQADSHTKTMLSELRDNMPDYQKKELAEFHTLFRMGGLRSNMLSKC